MLQKTALLLGASGLTGGHCLDYLLNDDHYNHVTALVRRPLPLEHPKLSQHQVDFNQLDDSLAGIQANDVFCCLGTTIKKAGSQKAFYEVDYTYPTEIAKLSLANGAEQFLLISAIGANPGSSAFYNRVKGEVEEEIARYGFKGFYVFRPSLLLGKRQERRPAEEFAEKFSRWFSFIFIGAWKQYKPVASRAVAYAMVKVAKKQPHGKQIIESNLIQSLYDQRQDMGTD